MKSDCISNTFGRVKKGDFDVSRLNFSLNISKPFPTYLKNNHDVCLSGRLCHYALIPVNIVRLLCNS